MTLGGSGSTAGVLGSTIAFVSVHDGRAILRVGDQEVSCTSGQTVYGGELVLRCSTVTGDSITVEVSRR